LSVVVCSHGRPADLRECLRALASAGDASLEVVVVDSASEPPLEPVVEECRSELAAVSYLYVSEPGLARARNIGMRAARGELIAFVDDDAAPARGWADAIRAAFARDSRIGCVGGTCRAVFPSGRARPRWLSDRLLCFAGITNFGDEPHVARSSAEWPFGANMAFRREALEGRGFDERLGRRAGDLASGEDSDMVARVQADGWTIWLEPSAVVDHTVHASRLEKRYYRRRLWAQGRSRAEATRRSAMTSVRLLAAVPVRSALYLLSRDRVHLYRLGESAGYFAARLARHAPPPG
jgi:GT2 family glycosyltransferase